MDIIEIIPPKQLNFCLPNDLLRVLTLTNLTLHSVSVLILKSHNYQISLSAQCFLMQAFQEKKIDITLNWNQESHNLSVGKLRIFYEEVEEETNEAKIRESAMKGKGKAYCQDINISLHLDGKTLSFLNYQVVQKQGVTYYQPISTVVQKKSYLMQRVSHLWQPPQAQRTINNNNQLKNTILSYLQTIPLIVSIESYEDCSFIIEFNQSKEDSCQIVSFALDLQEYFYAIKRLISYGFSQEMLPLVNLEANLQTRKRESKESNKSKDSNKREIKDSNKQTEKESKKIQGFSSLTEEVEKAQIQSPISKQKKEKLKNELIKQSFVKRRSVQKHRYRKKNKSEQKIIQDNFEEEDEANLLKEQMREIKQMEKDQVQRGQKKIVEKEVVKRVKKEVKVNQTNIELTQKILNVYIDVKEGSTEVYILLRDCIRCFVLEEPLAKKIIKFDPIYEQNANLPTPIDIYKQELIFGNQTCLFWVHLQTGESEWKYVQRKYIYAIAVIQELSLAAVGGKNFSKLSYFGKETSRSNIKLYSCSSSDKHQHLFTYDIPGASVGNVMNMAYISVPPHGTKLLLVHTLNSSSNSTFHFLRVKAFNKIEVYGQIDLDELGILNLRKVKYNRENSRIVCMESLGQTEMDTFKILKMKCQYEKVEVSTEGLKFPLRKYISFHLGGSKHEKNSEWMSIVDENGSLAHLYDFQSNQAEALNLGKGLIRQLFSVHNQRYLLVCTDTSFRILEKIEVEKEELNQHQ